MRTLIIQSESEIDLELISDLAQEKGAKHIFIEDNVLQEYLEDIELAKAILEVDNDDNATIDFDTFMTELNNASHN